MPESDSLEFKEKEVSFGKTQDGTVFKVPQTADVLVTLFTTREPFSMFEYIVIAVLLLEIFLLLFTNTPKFVFLFLYVFWRLAYNLVLGVLLRTQSNGNFIVRWCRRNGFDANNTKIERPKWTSFVISQLERKMGNTYKFNECPIEFNAWILFRGLVDLILVNDVACYIGFCFAYNNQPETLSFVDYLRYFGGVVMCTFNIWVKSDAHRVVRDFAWYWGDFFFMIESSLVFDGVFEMAPHPMYSVGYMWYYGASLISNSYTVLMVSIFGHFLQFAFLYFVENPHIEKTYGSDGGEIKRNESLIKDAYFRRDLIVFKNFDIFRSSDLMSTLLVFYAITMSLLLGPTDGDYWKKSIYVGHALLWRFFHTYVLGAVLFYQSKSKFWTKHFIKYGDHPRDAFDHWKTIYNCSLFMVYTSFMIAAIRLARLPDDYTYGETVVKVTMGLLMIMLHIWTSMSIYEVIGDLGWFYGDFFIDEILKSGNLAPRYTGIYRFLNNPEKLMGQTAFWGMALISNSWTLFAVTLFGQISTWLFLHYVEAPHMKKLYGEQLRAKAGVENLLTKEILKVVKKIDNETIKQLVTKWETKNDQDKLKRSTMAFDVTEIGRDDDDDDFEMSPTIEFDNSPTKNSLFKVVDKVVRQINIVNRVDELNLLVNVPTHLYKLTILKKSTTEPSVFSIGEPIKVKFRVPLNFLKFKDWIGIYKVSANSRKDLTTCRSDDRWQFLSGSNDLFADEHDFPISKAMTAIGSTHVKIFAENRDDICEGEVSFRGAQLPWKLGEFELRLHFDGKYSVLAISEKFAIVLKKKDAKPQKLEEELLGIVEYALDLSGVVPFDPLWKPLSVDDNIMDAFRSRIATFSSAEKEMCSRIVLFIKHSYAIEFNNVIVSMTQNVKSLAERIRMAQKTLH